MFYIHVIIFASTLDFWTNTIIFMKMSGLVILIKIVYIYNFVYFYFLIDPKVIIQFFFI